METCLKAPTLLDWVEWRHEAKIFDKSDLVHLRAEECKNHSHTLKLKNSEVIIIKAVKILAYMSLNSSWKVNPNGPFIWA
jgi:hypothetical protein